MKRMALLLVAVAARLVPLPARAGWASEWEAEIGSWWDDRAGRRGPAAGLLLVYRSLLVFRDAADVSYAVRERLRKLAIRVALGATSVRVRKQVLRDGFTLVLAGLAIGLALARVLGRFVEGMLFEVSAGDVTVFASVAAILSVVAVAAIYVPAFRASRADPISVLREE